MGDFMAIFWTKNCIVDENIVKLEIMIGESIIGDKMYYRVNGSKPVWFDLIGTPIEYIDRNAIIQKGLDLIHEKFRDIKITTENGTEFNWNEL